MIDSQTLNFINELVTSKKINLDDFEKNLNNLKFDNENSLLWGMLLLKPFETGFDFLMPLNNYLLDNNLFKIDKNILKITFLRGYEIDTFIRNSKTVESEINKNMKDFYFDEKIVISNSLADNLLSWAQKIISKADLNDVLEIEQEMLKLAPSFQNSTLISQQNNSKKIKL